MHMYKWEPHGTPMNSQSNSVRLGLSSRQALVSRQHLSESSGGAGDGARRWIEQARAPHRRGNQRLDGELFDVGWTFFWGVWAIKWENYVL